MNSRRLYTVRVRELAELAAAQLGLPVVEAFAAPAAAEDPVEGSGRLRQVTQRLQLQRAGIAGTVLLVDDSARSKWTITQAACLLQEAGAEEVVPVVVIGS